MNKKSARKNVEVTQSEFVLLLMLMLIFNVARLVLSLSICRDCVARQVEKKSRVVIKSHVTTKQRKHKRSILIVSSRGRARALIIL